MLLQLYLQLADCLSVCLSGAQTFVLLIFLAFQARLRIFIVNVLYKLFNEILCD